MYNYVESLHRVSFYIMSVECAELALIRPYCWFILGNRHLFPALRYYSRVYIVQYIKNTLCFIENCCILIGRLDGVHHDMYTYG